MHGSFKEHVVLSKHVFGRTESLTDIDLIGFDAIDFTNEYLGIGAESNFTRFSSKFVFRYAKSIKSPTVRPRKFRACMYVRIIAL